MTTISTTPAPAGIFTTTELVGAIQKTEIVGAIDEVRRAHGPNRDVAAALNVLAYTLLKSNTSGAGAAQVRTDDQAAELRRAIAETRAVFESEPVASDALNYLESVLASAPTNGGGASITKGTLASAGAGPVVGAAQQAASTATADQAAAALAAESAQKWADAERGAARAAARSEADSLAVLSREVFSLADKLQQPADLVVQLMALAELRVVRQQTDAIGAPVTLT